MSALVAPRDMTAEQLYDHLVTAWRTNRRPGEVAREMGAPIADVTAFYGCMYRNTDGALRGARSITTAHVGLRKAGRR